ncbi:MAG: hypothetical protein L6E13_09770 [Firmicutes bacterium]|nr:hypothetical protein [Bacillota bacterium]
MGNAFRRLVSVLLLAVFGVAVWRFVQQTAGQPGVAGLVLRQALWLVGIIGGVLFLAWRFRPRN